MFPNKHPGHTTGSIAEIAHWTFLPSGVIFDIKCRAREKHNGRPIRLVIQDNSTWYEGNEMSPTELVSWSNSRGSRVPKGVSERGDMVKRRNSFCAIGCKMRFLKHMVYSSCLLTGILQSNLRFMCCQTWLLMFDDGYEKEMNHFSQV